MTARDWLGPVDYLILHVEPGGSPAEGLRRIEDLVEAGTVRLLDVEAVVHGDDGPRAMGAGEWGDRIGADLHAVDGALSGLLGDDDLDAALDGTAEGTAALVVVYEVTAFRDVFDAWDAPGLQLAGSGPVAEDDLVAALADEPTA